MILRRPFEDNKVTISRAAGTMTFPADFLLIAALSPCPCGFPGNPNREANASRTGETTTIASSR
ncbi:ATP-binding protein [Verrucomicrobiota bacterium sgz303538]